MIEAKKREKTKRILEKVMENYQVANEIAENEGFETNYQQDKIHVDFILKELSLTPNDIEETDIDKADANEEAFLTGQSFLMITCDSKQSHKTKLRYTHLNKNTVTIAPAAAAPN